MSSLFSKELILLPNFFLGTSGETYSDRKKCDDISFPAGFVKTFVSIFPGKAEYSPLESKDAMVFRIRETYSTLLFVKTVKSDRQLKNYQNYRKNSEKSLNFLFLGFFCET